MYGRYFAINCILNFILPSRDLMVQIDNIRFDPLFIKVLNRVNGKITPFFIK